MQNFVFAVSVRTGGRAGSKILMFVQVVIVRLGVKNEVFKNKVRSNIMGNWGSVSREDFESSGRDRRKTLDEHSRKVRQDCDDHNRKIKGWIEDFNNKYVKNLK